MKITQAVIDQTSSHDFVSEREISMHTDSSFRTVFNQVSEITNSGLVDKTGEAARITQMLERLIARILAILTGKPENQTIDLRETLQPGTEPDSARSRPRKIVEMTWKTERTERIFEHENTCFTSKGKIETSEGDVLSFNLSMEMKRNFVSETTLTASGNAELCDPLVINFGGKTAELSGKCFSFDLDVDGQSESINALGSTSGYLAIDRNGDGAINDGSELFGSRSGDGFAELSELDSDGNHWLDEADVAYDKLLVWKKDGSGMDSLNTLRETGVGALYLGSVETPFDLTDDENKLLAHIRASGIYLMENGQVGSLQQVDQAIGS